MGMKMFRRSGGIETDLSLLPLDDGGLSFDSVADPSNSLTVGKVALSSEVDEEVGIDDVDLVVLDLPEYDFC